MIINILINLIRRNNMNKEKILAKSRKENGLNDERDQWMEFKGANFSITVLICVWLCMEIFLPIESQTQGAVGFLTNITCLANFGYQLGKTGTKINDFMMVLFTFTTGLYLYLFIGQL